MTTVPVAAAGGAGGGEAQASAAMAAPVDASQHAPAAEPTHVECPLCGYDQTGAIATFRGADSSPLTGRCPECGLDWFWGDLLHPAKQLPRWFAENPRRFAPLVLVSTWRRALRPRWFWRDVLVTMPIHRARLAAFATIALVLCYLIAAAAAGLREVWLVQSLRMPAGTLSLRWLDWQRVAEAAALPIVSWPNRSAPLLSHFTVLAVAWVLLMPLPFLVLRQTFMRVRVRPVHLRRIWAYSLAPLPLFVLGIDATKLTASWLQYAVGSGYGSSGSRALLWTITSSAMEMEWVVVPAAAAWLALFWSRAVTRYLRLPNARAVVVLMLVASFLAAIAIAAYYPASRLAQQVGFWFAW